MLAPTRELAAQIADEFRPLADVADRRVATFYGGVGFKDQLSALRQGVDIAVGCPGRLIDLLDRREIMLGDVEIVVVDEADRMSDMGFLPAVRRLLDQIPPGRQTMLFSATLTRDVERLVRDYQRDPTRHVLDASAHDVGSRTHEFWRARREDRTGLTARLVSSHSSSIVFCRTKRGVDRLTRHLSQAGLSSSGIHGDRTQAQRDRALAQFKGRRAQVLVGTDVAARGLHVEGVDCVVHFDPPEDEDTYVHRSGRTGRAGASGLVVSLVTVDQEAVARRLQQRLGIGTSLQSAPGAADHDASSAVDLALSRQGPRGKVAPGGHPSGGAQLDRPGSRASAGTRTAGGRSFGARNAPVASSPVSRTRRSGRGRRSTAGSR